MFYIWNVYKYGGYIMFFKKCDFSFFKGLFLKIRKIDIFTNRGIYISKSIILKKKSKISTYT